MKACNGSDICAEAMWPNTNEKEEEREGHSEQHSRDLRDDTENDRQVLHRGGHVQLARKRRKFGFHSFCMKCFRIDK